MIKGSANNCHHPVIQKAVFIQEASNVTNDQPCMATWKQNTIHILSLSEIELHGPLSSQKVADYSIPEGR